MIENGKIEYKIRLSDTLEKDVVSFLNAHGGEIYIGIDDDGSVAGTDDPDAVQLALSDRIRNNIRPETIGLFDKIREKLWKEYFWSRSYCLITAGGAPLEILKEYIRTQGEDYDGRKG